LIDLTFDRPEIVFLILKKDYLINLIVKCFGEIAVFVYIIQKRALSYIHVLVNLKYNFNITTSQIVDKCISAKIPNSCENHTLQGIEI